VNVHARRFPLVDALRALAALSVLAFHALGLFGGGLRPDAAIRPYVARLESGVVVFLLISGFLLYRPFVRARLRGEPQVDVAAYGWRRFLRIVPAYWVALVIAVLVVPLHGVLTGSHALTYLGFGQIYDHDTIGGGIGPAWTLGLELTFYAMLPAWAWAMRRTGAPELRALAGLWLASMAYKGVLLATGAVHAGTGPEPALVSLPGYLDEFALGMALAVISVRLEGRAPPAPVRLLERRPGVAWLAAAGAFLLAARGIGLTGDPLQRYTTAEYLARNAVYGLMAVCLLAPAIFGDERRTPLRRVLANPVALWLGLVSYGIYLWHWPVLLRLASWDLGSVSGIHPYLLWGVSAAALSIALGAASYYLVERPALSLKRLVGRAPARPDEAVAEPAP
jgi:peptidoglycan/LPS O-acetylase OafA/YrhL